MKRNIFACYVVLKAIRDQGQSPAKIDTAFGLDMTLFKTDEDLFYLNSLIHEGYIEAKGQFNEEISPDEYRFVRLTWKGLRFIEVYEQCEEMKEHASNTFEKMLCDAIVLQL